jgi:ABC-type nickel/cobalt efflux system permease component RcnA
MCWYLLEYPKKQVMVAFLAAIVTALFSIGVYTLISEGTRADAEQTPIDSSFLIKMAGFFLMLIVGIFTVVIVGYNYF